MNTTDPDLDRAGLRALLFAGSDDLPPDIDLLRGVRERRVAGRQRSRRMRTLVPAGALAAAVSSALATLLATSVGGAPSALAAVTSAVASTTAQSYSFSLSSTINTPGHPVSDVMTGAFDRSHRRGTETFGQQSPPAPRGSLAIQIRFIAGYVYTWASIPAMWLGHRGKPWDKAPVPPQAMGVRTQNLIGLSAEQPISPEELLGVLRSLATVRLVGPASGPGWTGTEYAFTASLESPLGSVDGTVFVDQQGRVRRLVTNFTGLFAALPPGADRRRVPGVTDVLTFGNFGAPVAVSPPPASQVTYTPTAPNWVFGL